jgi:hypothetical protein
MPKHSDAEGLQSSEVGAGGGVGERDMLTERQSASHATETVAQI